MKTAVSIPDRLFRRLEDQRQSLGISRSQLVQQALEEWLDARTPGDVTEQFNAVADAVETKLRPAQKRAQRRALPAEEW